MSWLVRKLDFLIGAIFGTAGGMALSQAQAFTNAYLQRLGGRLDEARSTLQRIADGDVLATASASVRAEAMTEQTARVEELQGLYTAILQTDPLLRPLALLRSMDWSIAERAFDVFIPGLPLNTAGMVYTFTGIFLALALYELFKLPFVAATRLMRGGGRRKQPSRR